MIAWLEKNYYVSFVITVIIGVVIFYLSSQTFGTGTGTGGGYLSILYHIFAFFFFALFLLFYAVRGKYKSLLILVVLISVVYGMLDEFHQYFVPGRHFSIFDMMLDSTGILLASVLYFLRIKIRKN